MYPAVRVVHYNRGFGTTFWLVMGVLVLVLLSLAAARWNSLGDSAIELAAIAAISAALLLLARGLQATAFELDLARGTLRKRRREVPLAAVTRIDCLRLGRAGTWIQLWTEGPKPFVRFAPYGAMFADPGIDQWIGLRHLLIVSSPPAPQSGRSGNPAAPPNGVALGVGEAISILDAQRAWSAAGRRQGSRQAPIRTLFGKAVVLRATQWRGDQPT